MATDFLSEEIDLVSKAFLFTGIKQADVERAIVDSRCERVRFERDSVIYSRYDFLRSLGVVLSGAIRVSKDTDDGHRIIISTLETGSLFGAAALFNEYEQYVTVLEAIEECTVLFFTQELIEQLMRRDFRIAKNYICYLSGRIHFLNDKISGLTAGSAERKLARYLMDNATPGKNGKLEVRLSRGLTELAKSLNIGRASLYRALDSLTASGTIEKEGKTIRLLESDTLRQL